MRISDWSSDVCSSDLDHRPCDGDALLLPSRKRGGPRRRTSGQAHPFEQFGDMIVDLGLADASDPQREGHIVERRQMRDETEILKHHPDPPPARWKDRKSTRLNSSH